MSFARRRAAIACLYCRHRKRRCDGVRPVCGLCSISEVPCEYPGKATSLQRPDQAADETNDLLQQRIQELESLVESQREQISQAQRPVSRMLDQVPVQTASPLLHSVDPRVDVNTPRESLAHTALLESVIAQNVDLQDTQAFPPLNLSPEAMLPASSPRTLRIQLPMVCPLPYVRSEATVHDSLDTVSPADDEEESITIPARHHTTTASLFTLQFIRNLVGYYPPNLFYDIESSRNVNMDFKLGCDISLLAADMNMDQDTTAALISNFFAYIHPKFPIIDQAGFAYYFNQTFVNGFAFNPDTAVCLLVLALGVIGNTENPVEHDHDEIGMPYFRVAYQILTTQWAVTLNARAQSTGLVLAALYFCFWAQPLAAWKMAYLASNSLQLLANDLTTATSDSDYGDMLSRLCWTCFAIECDSLSEFHLPRSGIEVAIDRMYFPRLKGHNDRDALMFLAFCSIRRLLNRIHNAVYVSAKTTTTPSASAGDTSNSNIANEKSAFSDVMSLETVIDELQRQLDTWYDSLPEMIKPDLSTNVPLDTQDAWLRLRYWSAKHIIGRPALIYATTSAKGRDLPDFVYRYAEMCIQSSRSYIETAIPTLGKRTQYSWMVVQACLSNSMMLVLAASNAKLQHLVPDVQEILQSLPKPLSIWATPDSSAETVILILRTLRHKIRLRSFPNPAN